MRHSCAASAAAVILIAFASTTFDAAPNPVAPSPSGAQRTEGDHRLRGEEALVRVYDFILEARFDQVEAELRRACGPAPPEACDVLAATAIWWRILLDRQSEALDDEFSAAVERAIAWVRTGR